MTEQDDSVRIWDLIEKADVGMLTTRFGGGLRARPLEPRPDRDAGLIRFITDVRGWKDDEIKASPDVGFVVIDATDNAYLSITGRARVTRDPAMAKAIWRKTDNMWWSGPDDPNVRVLVLEPSLAELWDGPSSKIVMAIELMKAQITGDKPSLGENRKKTVELH